MHKPIAYYSRSIGPFPEETVLNRRFKRLSLELLKYFSFLSLRDRKSKQIADDLNINYVSAIDTAFLEQPRCEITSELQNNLQDKYVIFVPNQLTWHYAYRNASAELIKKFYLSIMQLLRQEYPSCQIVMLPQLCSLPDGIGDYWYFKELQHLDGGEDIYVVPDTFGSDIQQTIISKAQCVVGARYHTIVFSINNEVPFVALNYEHKIAGLLEELNLSDHIADITQAFNDKGSMTRCIEDITSTLKDIKHTKPQRDTAHRLASDCLQHFLAKLNNY
jgi:colanic acid/amylovoran biosynthesis protein